MRVRGNEAQIREIYIRSDERNCLSVEVAVDSFHLE